MRRIKRRWVFFLVGVLLGAFAMLPVYIEARRAAQKLEELQAGTRDAWLNDRRDWQAGKPFRFNYGSHHRRW